MVYGELGGLGLRGCWGGDVEGLGVGESEVLRVRAGVFGDARDGVVEAEGFELENFD